jgi:hypothetical protein
MSVARRKARQGKSLTSPSGVWAYMGFDVSPSILNALKFDRRTATLCYAYSGHTSGDMAAMAISAGFMQEFSSSSPPACSG